MQTDTGRRLWAGPGGAAEVLRLAWPLILSNSFWTLQITVDRVLLSWFDSVAVGAALAGVMLFWLLFALVQATASYATTFVAQYIGAGRPQRVGPILWQSLYFSLAAGLLFMLLSPWAHILIGLYDHSAELQDLETAYFRCLCFAALPMALMASATSLFLGQGKTWLVLVVNGVGLILNAVLDYAWISGAWGLPCWGIAGAGWATVVSSWGAAVVALALLFLPSHQRAFATLRSWRFEPALFRRLLRFGVPSGIQWAMDSLALTLFSVFVGRLGEAEMSATSIAFTINLLAFLPTMGIGQAVTILVGRRLGENRADLAARSTWTGFVLAWSVMALIGLTFVLAPQFYVGLFQSQSATTHWQAVAELVPGLLRVVALYCLFDSMNLVFSFALKGAGDTRFVTLATVTLAWPILVLPTWLAWYCDLGIFWAWGALCSYVVTLGLTFLLRFRQGRWKTMRVIEAAAVDEAVPAVEGISAMTRPISPQTCSDQEFSVVQ